LLYFQAAILAIMVNAGSPNAVLEMEEVQAVARRLGLAVVRSEVRGYFQEIPEGLRTTKVPFTREEDPLLFQEGLRKAGLA
jgi:hypothetical protein